MWITLSIIIIDLLVICTHTLALILLVNVRQNNVQGHQKMLLLALCETEITFAVINIGEELCCILEMKKVADILFIFLFSCLSLLNLFIMFLITMDRYLTIRLNIKYNIFCPPKKMVIVLLVLLTTSFLPLIPSYAFGLKKVLAFGSLYFYPILGTTFVISASVIYFYIMKQVLRNRRNLKRLRKQLKENNKIVCPARPSDRFKLFIPTLIIVTFVTFMLGAVFVLAFSQYKNVTPNMNKIPMVLISVNYVADSLIYVFSLKSIRSAIKSRIWPKISV